MTLAELPTEFLLYVAEDGQTRVDVRVEDENVWLSQLQLANLFDKDLRTVNEHIKNIYDEGELGEEATLRKFRIVQTEGNRAVTRGVAHYNLDMIIAVGFRVRSSRGTQFRQWANARLGGGCTVFDECLSHLGVILKQVPYQIEGL